MALAAGVGFLAASFLGPAVERDRRDERPRPPRPRPEDDEPATKLDSLMTKNEG